MVKILVRERKSADERKKQILDVALELFSNYSYSSILMDDIAKACNIARTTLYEYYSNKEEMLIAWLKGWPLRHERLGYRETHVRNGLSFLQRI
ncbi:hypothetical protein CSE16_08170 [Solibacillus sp. R5-41]|uniref:TetR/AcrR family transcriptional regulator n=1 Tax=Solibacillus sp. R5-41 TaxID=2048654 RepID=UPI000C128E10|nr:hypothetical protein CSE16_08170 [Solibacillus sp. R5-41]